MSALSPTRRQPLATRHPLWSVLAPALGYGCFRGASALIYAGESTTQSSAILFAAHAGPTAWATLAVAASALIVYAGGRLRPSAPVRTCRTPMIAALLATVVLALVPVMTLAHASAGSAIDHAHEIALSLLYAVAATIMSLLWLCTLTRYGAAHCIGSFLGGMAVLAVVTIVALPLDPDARGTMALLLLALNAGLLAYTRGVKPPHQITTAATAPISPVRTTIYPLVTPLLITGVLESVFGLLSGFFVGAQLSINSRIAFTAGASAGFLYALAHRSAAVQATGFKRLFPLVITVVALVPLVGRVAVDVLGAAFGFLYIALSIQVMTCVLTTVCARPSHALGALSLVTCVRYLGRGGCLVAGIYLGHSMGAQISQGLLIVSLVGIYLWGLALWHTEHGYVASFAPAPRNARETSDPLARHVAALAKTYRLTPREQQVCELIAHGRSATFIGEALSCTPATVRTHTKNLYAKLGVHSKQELISLFECGEHATGPDQAPLA